LLWKVSLEKGDLARLVENVMPQGESPDGRFYYYARPGGNLFRAPLQDGHFGVPEVELPIRVIRSQCAPLDDGVYFIGPREKDGTFALRFYEFSSGRTTTLLSTRQTPWYGLSVAPDRRSILYTQVDQEGADLMLVENFR
jgi:hypothetical protein